MKPNEYAKLLEYVNNNNKLGAYPRKQIKYVSCNFDTRDGLIWSLSFRCWMKKEPTVFSIDRIDEKKLTYENVINWLKEEL